MNQVNLSYEPYLLKFKVAARTSRGVLYEKPSWFIRAVDPQHPSVVGIGECSVIPGLSPEFTSAEAYTRVLNSLCADQSFDISGFSSIKFGLESALLDLKNGGKSIYFQNRFTTGIQKIPINGLVWMGDAQYMQQQITEKLKEGFTTIKLKIGAIAIHDELNLIRKLRNEFSSSELTIRVDANGAFVADKVFPVLEQLAKLEVHSIEQPVKAGNPDLMELICRNSPIPVALDEELIGIDSYEEKVALLTKVKPQFIILKPSLHGGISGTISWIEIAERLGIQWWMTSALESNIGLNTICQLTAEYKNPLPQGLGTGSLYTNNVPSKLTVEHGNIFLKD